MLRDIAEDQFPIAGDRQLSRTPRVVGDLELVELDRRVGRHIDAQFRRQALFGVIENAIAESVAHDVGVLPARRQRRGGPEVPRLFIAQIDGFAAGIGDGIVVPGGEPELMAVFRPGIGAAPFRHDGAELRVGDHVHPRRGRRLAGGQDRHVLAAVVAETAQAVEERQIAPRGLVGDGRLGPAAQRLQMRDRDFGPSAALDLLRQRSAVIQQYDARHGLQQRTIFFRHLLAAADEDAAGPVDERRFGTGGDEIHDGFLQRLPIDRIVFVPDHQIDGEPFQPPVRVRLHRLAHQRDALVVANPHQHDRQVPRDAVAPQSRLPPPIAAEDARLGPAQRRGINDRAGQAAIDLRIRFGSAQLLQQDLAVRPGEVEDAIGQAGIAVLLGQRFDAGARLGDAGDDVDPHGLIRLQQHRLADANDRIEDRPFAVGKGRLAIECRGGRERPAAGR